jgi:aminoglycoside phosphotransferase (APT) family kinase protein
VPMNPGGPREPSAEPAPAVEELEVVVAHADRVTLRVGDTFLKVDGDSRRLDAEAAAMSVVPVPTPRILWRQKHVLALATVEGSPLERLGHAASAPATAWISAGAAVRTLHSTPLPDRFRTVGEPLGHDLDAQCDWLVAAGVLPADLVARNRALADRTERGFAPVFTHGDLQVGHVFVEGDRVTGVIDWSEAGAGDPLFDLATLTLGHPERLDDVLAGYRAGDVGDGDGDGGDGNRDIELDVDVIRAWWSRRSLVIIRWLLEHGFDPFAPGCEVDVLRAA